MKITLVEKTSSLLEEKKRIDIAELEDRKYDLCVKLSSGAGAGFYNNANLKEVREFVDRFQYLGQVYVFPL